MKINVNFELEQPEELSVLEEIVKRFGPKKEEVYDDTIGIFDLTDVFKNMLKANPSKWFTAGNIADEVEKNPDLSPKAEKWYETKNFKGNLAKGIAMCGKVGEADGWAEVDKSRGAGFYKYKWKA